VALQIQVGTPGKDAVPVMVTAAPPVGISRAPVDICCVVDVSGSMSAEAVVQTESGIGTGHGLTVLDIVKHAMKTIIRNSQAHDRLAVVAYSNDAKIIFGATVMDNSGRDTADTKLDELIPNGMTNLWDGLKVGMEVLRSAAEPGRLQHIMLFTDGLPNINPPRGILPMLKRQKDKEGGKLPCTISTFGFGYDLDSQLLSDLAIQGSGTYAFIPDAGFVGTVFVNAMTNILVTMAMDAKLTLTPQNGATFAPGLVLGGHPVSKVGDSLVVSLGCLHFGQSKDVIVNMSGIDAADAVQAQLEYQTRAGGAPASVMKKDGSTRGEEESLQVEAQRCRLEFVDRLREAMNKVKITPAEKAQGKEHPVDQGQALILALADNISESPAHECNDAVKALLEDIQGQVSEALSREDWYSKWGVHYMPSLMCAHLSQTCNNFKDPGVQHYGGDLFQKLRDEADDIFISLPAPKPREVAPTPTPVAAAPAAPAPAVQMAAFYDRFSG